MLTQNLPPVVLVVDDHFANVKLLSSILRSPEFEIIEAESGEEALQLIEGREVAVALVDIMMPGMTGTELAVLLHERPSKIPVIFVTARDGSGDELESYYDTGAVDFIQKPFNKKIIQAKVKVFMDLFNQKRNIELQRLELEEMNAELRKSNIIQKETEKMYRAILNASPSGIMISDRQGLITEISAIVFEIFHTERKDHFIGRHILDVFPAPEKKRIRSMMKQAYKEGIVQNVEIMIPGNDSQVIAEVAFTLIQDLNGIQQGLMCIVRDVSQRKLMEQQLIRSERLISLGEMASAMAHEINQPLLSMSLGLDNMMRKLKKLDVHDHEYFIEKSESIFKDINRIDRIIEHVRAFSRDQKGQVYSLFSVNESIRNALSMVDEQFNHHGIEVRVDLAEGLPEISGDTYKFEQVMLNLLVNSKDALSDQAFKERKFTKVISISSWLRNDQIFVKVADNGHGIEEKNISRIMLPFFTTKETGKGTGLGLSISYSIIKELNGSIEVKSKTRSQAGDGSTGTQFTISLPVLLNQTAAKN